MSQPFTYVFMDRFPAIPQDLLGDLRRYQGNEVMAARMKVTDDDSHEHATHDYHYRNETEQELHVELPRLDPKSFYGFDITGPLRTWLEANITNQAFAYMATFAGPLSETQRDRVLHVDRSRDYVLIYVVETGGSDVRTKFYKYRDRPLELPREMAFQTLSTEGADLVDEVVLPVGRWAFLNGKTAHQVTNLESERVSIHLSLDVKIF
jgi:hypothetical protein